MPETPRSSERLDGSKPVRQWLLDYGFKVVEPTPEVLRDLDRVMEHDEFWVWASGKVEFPVQGNTIWRQAFRDLVMIGSVFVGFFLVLSAIAWLLR